MRNNMEVPQKIKNRTNLLSSNFTSGYLLERDENTNLKRYVHRMLIVALFIMAKKDVVATYMFIYG